VAQGFAPAAALPQPAAPVPVAVPSPTAPELAPATHDGHPVKSPMVGTFYRTPSPDAKPFVEVGQSVKEGQIICIIEAMKLMNEINAECDGEVVKVYVENGQAVQYGERLFALKPA
jgi:acetyl-CoA carboxylase biotin carboxyl carrier protein